MKFIVIKTEKVFTTTIHEVEVTEEPGGFPTVESQAITLSKDEKTVVGKKTELRTNYNVFKLKTT